MMGYSFSFGVLLMLLVALVLSAFRILREYERGVVFQLGRFWKVKGPGLILVIPFLQQMVFPFPEFDDRVGSLHPWSVAGMQINRRIAESAAPFDHASKQVGMRHGEA